ncbi:MAG: hypothetical protein ACK5PS_06610 [Desulfopila sp.]
MNVYDFFPEIAGKRRETGSGTGERRGIFFGGPGKRAFPAGGVLSETRQYEKVLYRGDDFHSLLWLRLSGPAMLVYPKLISTENAVTAPGSFMVCCG